MATDARIAAVSGTGLPVRGDDIDTDRIIPARYLKAVTFEGLGEHAFQDERVAADGSRTGHPLDDPRYAGANVLFVNRNFGCGSSREHAPQALYRYGIRAIVGGSFAEIFAGNCLMIGLPAVTSERVGEWQDRLQAAPDTPVRVDLEARAITLGDDRYPLEMPEAARRSLVSGTWDATAALLAGDERIGATAARIPYLGWSTHAAGGSA